MRIFETENYNFEYIESDVTEPVLWENHCHGRFEMIGVINGDINIMIEGKKYRLTENHIAIIPPLSYHTVTANKQGRYARITTLFDDVAIPVPIRQNFAKGKRDIFIVSSAQIVKIMEICRGKNREIYAPLAESLMIQLFYENVQTEQAGTETEVDQFLQKSVDYIEKHLTEKITLEDLAKHTLRSKSSFSHLFEEKMKITPKQYILRKKLALANKLICEGLPPTVVAARVGYENYSNFYRMYSKHFGSRPARRK